MSTDTATKIFGHTFRPMTEDEHMMFAGAGSDGLICELHEQNLLLVFCPSEGFLEEHDCTTGIAKQFKYLGAQETL